MRRICSLYERQRKNRLSIVEGTYQRMRIEPASLLVYSISPAFLATPRWRLFCSCVGIDIQRGGELAVAEDTRYRCHIRTARDHQAGSGVAQAVDIELLSVDIPPLQGAALAAPHPRGNDKLKVCLILDALIFQCGDDFLRRFFVGNLFPCFLTCVARHGSGDRTPISMEYVFCCELRVSFMAGRLALPRLALEEEIDVPITGNVLSGNGFPVMSRFG